MAFIDRSDAGRRLAEALVHYKTQQPVIFALPRGGVPVAAEIAISLHAPLDLVIVRKVGVPWQPELAMGAVADGTFPIIIRNEQVIRDAGIEQHEFELACGRELGEIARRKRLYLGRQQSIDLARRTAILVDDGIATGASVRAALNVLKKRIPKTIVLAVPVAPADTLDMLRNQVDDIVCLERYEPFSAIGVYYRNFAQLSDKEVIDILAQFKNGARQPEATR